MDRILVIPDVHHKVDLVDAILDKENGNFDKIVWLADFFDNWSDTEYHAIKTAKWLKNKLDTRQQDIFICSNHDTAYRFPNNPYLFCSGFSKQKSLAINSIIKKSDWDRFKLVHFEQGIAFSHAGINEVLMHPMDASFNQEYIEKTCKKALLDAETGIKNYVFGAGFCRGGGQHYGGPLWAHFPDEISPIKGINQLIGHTIVSPEPKYLYLPNKKKAISWVLNLDTNLHHYAIVTDGVPKIKKVSDKMYEKYDWRLIDGKNPITNEAWRF